MLYYNLPNHIGVEEVIFANWMAMIGTSSSQLQK